MTEMELLQQPVGQIVRQNFRTSTLFLKNGIDFCCGGSRSLSQAIDEAGVNPQTFLNDLTLCLEQQQPEHDFDHFTIDQLIEFILTHHHDFIYNESEATLSLMNKVLNAHGANHPELTEVHSIVNRLVEDLHEHQSKEENILFPYILNLNEVALHGGEIGPSCFGDVRNPIGAMEADHEVTGGLLMRLKEITNRFTVPADACVSYTTLYQRLQELFNNILQHVHLENNLLHPQAIELQNRLNKQS